MKYPIGIQDFKTVRENGYFYADKSAMLYKLVKTQDYIYILEFKLDKSADDVLRQIEDKQYAKPFECGNRLLYKIGVNFSTKTRRIDGWKMKI